MDKLVSVSELDIGFPKGMGWHLAVQGVSFYVGVGETVGVVGESGCGKSMTGFSLVGLIPKPGVRLTGEITFDNKSLVDHPNGRDEMSFSDVRGLDIGVVFQEPLSSLNPVMRIGDQVSEVFRFRLSLPKNEANERTLELLDTVQIPRPHEIAQCYPHQLSGGMRQRVVIAIALAGKPRLLIADEPTTALDVTTQAQILELFQRTKESEGHAVLLISHDFSVIGSVCDRVIVMYAGKVVESGPTALVLKTPKHPYSQALMAIVKHLQNSSPGRELPTIPGQVPDIGARHTACPFYSRCRQRRAICSEKSPELVGDFHQVACWLHT